MVVRTDVLPTGRRSRPAGGQPLPPGQFLGAGRGREAAKPFGVTVAVITAAVAVSGLVNPKAAAGNVAPVDIAMLLGICGVLLWALFGRVPVRLPYVVPMTALMSFGLLAAMLSRNPPQGALAVIQEIFLLCWCAAVATFCRTPRTLALVLRTWAVSATGWASLLILAVVTHQRELSGSGAGNVTKNVDTSGLSGGTRARLLFDHPNMAGNFFMVAVFIVVASGYPRNRLLRGGACVVLLVAMFLTGSNAAMVSLVVGAVVTAFLRLRARAGMVKATAFASVLVVVLGVGWFEVAVPVVDAAQQSNIALLRNSLGRGVRSADARASLFLSQVHLYEHGSLLGIGPSGTRDALGAAGAVAVKQAHNDYLGTLVERGPLGELALMLLLGAVGIRAAGVTRRPLSPRLAEVVPIPAALVGACAAFAATALTHEVLHYRWLWTLLALVAALHRLNREESSADGGAPESAGGRGWHGAPVAAGRNQ